MTELLLKWNHIYIKGTTLSISIIINVVVFADDRVLIVDSEDNWQTGVFTLQTTANIFEMEIPPEKSETFSFLGQDPARYKIVVDNKCLQ
jgi:hypothetical protein